MDRAALAAAVALRIPGVLADAGILGTDTAGNLKEPIDDALRALGVGEDALAAATTDDPVGAIALAKHHALKRAQAAVADRFNVSVGGGSYALGTAFGNIERLVAQSEKELLALFGTVHPCGPGGFSLDLGFLEPAGAGW